jgi:urease accessory protein
MLRVQRRAEAADGAASEVLALPYDQRKKSRLLARTQSGQEVAIVLERGSMLRDGDLLAAEGGVVLRVTAAPESVSQVVSGDALLLARAAYHLGNRHVPLQIEAGELRYQHDHVLDGMVRELGLGVSVGMAGFQPEGGAYGRGHSHGHWDEHGGAHAGEGGAKLARFTRVHDRGGR